MKRILWILMCFVIGTHSQTFDAKSLSLAGSAGAYTRGVDAVSWNPANLALPRGNAIELNLLSLNTAIYNSSFSIHNYNRYFSEEGHGGYWSPKDRRQILDLIPDDGLSLRLDHSMNILGVAFNNFGFAIQWEAAGIARINAKRPLEIALFGETIDTLYAYRENKVANADAYSAIKTSISYAYPFEAGDLFDLDDLIPGLEELAAGVNVNFYMGLGVGQIRKSYLNARRVNAEAVEYNIHLQTRTSSVEDGFPAGRGIGFDLGINGRYRKNWYFSAALQNLFAGITWNGKTELTEFIERDSTNRYEDEEVDYSFSEDSTFSISSFRTSLPKILSFGAMYRYLPNLLFTMDWRQGLDTHFGNTSTPRIGFGTQYTPLEWLALRGGLSVGGKETFLFGMGAGLQFRHLQFDLSYGLNKALWPSYSRGILTAMALKVMF